MLTLPYYHHAVEHYNHIYNEQTNRSPYQSSADVDIPLMTHGHGWTISSGELMPLWADGPILSHVLVDEKEGQNSGDLYMYINNYMDSIPISFRIHRIHR